MKRTHPTSGRTLKPYEFMPEDDSRHAAPILDSQVPVKETAREIKEKEERLAAHDASGWRWYYSKPMARCKYCGTRSRLNVHRKGCRVLEPALF